MEISDAHDLDRSADQLFLAAGARCQLGAWAIFSRAAPDSWMVVPDGLSDSCSATGVRANPPGVALVDKPADAILGCNRLTSLSCRKRLLRRLKQSFRADRPSRRVLHPYIGRDVTHLRHAFELGADCARLLHLLFNLKGNQVADGVVGQVKEGVNHVGVNPEQNNVFLLKNGGVIT